MSRSYKISALFLLVVPLLAMLVGCSTGKTTTNPNLVWVISLQKYEVKDKLESVQTVQQYVGTTQQYHQQTPAPGNVYLLMEISVNKQGTDATTFDWSNLSIQDSTGNTYQRSDNDSFLEIYNYTPRMTGLAITFGDNQGWVCFEIPQSAANGTLTLVYNGSGSQQQVTVKK